MHPSKKKPIRDWFIFAGLSVWGLLAVSCVATSRTLVAPPQIPGAEFIGSSECAECHEDKIGYSAGATHARLVANDADGKHAVSCESCHGPGSLHNESGGDPGLIAMPNDASCLACHASTEHRYSEKKAPMDWYFSAHRAADVGCIDCHNAHSTEPKGLRARSPMRVPSSEDPEGDFFEARRALEARLGENNPMQVQDIDRVSSLCLSCHQDVLGRLFMPFHHPVREGAMSCTSCHDPHSNQSQRLLAKNETCYDCHQAQQGPFSREHQPVVEDCTICHDPHGSPFPKMAKIGQPMLCVQCHTLTNNRHTNALRALSPAALRDCTACHGSIHGSDIDPYMRH